jgi:uncharacterized damage-inducible protein DinB
MPIRDQVQYMIETNQQVAKRLLDDIDEEESMARGGHGFNHIRWQAGHLLYSCAYVLSLFGDTSEDLEQLKKDFGGGTEISDDPSAYPSLADLRDRLYHAHDRAISRAKEMADADFDKDVGDGENKHPIWQSVIFLCMHGFYHAGQVVQTRKILGRERPFA